MDIGPRKRKALNIGQLLAYLRSVGVEEPESVPIYFPDELPAVLAAYDAAEGMLILSDLGESPLPAGSNAVDSRCEFSRRSKAPQLTPEGWPL